MAVQTSRTARAKTWWVIVILEETKKGTASQEWLQGDRLGYHQVILAGYITIAFALLTLNLITPSGLKKTA
jgi:hypothetical protein